MTGENVPYHLRPNKHVERLLFVELLEKFDRWCRVEDAAYVSLGGRLLEDQKLIHDRFGTTRLMSLEADEVTHRRQIFNIPLGLISCARRTTGDFVAEFDAITATWGEANRIIWFDYTAPKSRQNQLAEIQMLVSKLFPNDLLKVTFNASLRTLCPWDRIEDPNERQEQALDGLKKKLGPWLPINVTKQQMTSEGLAAVLLEAAKKAFLEGLTGDRQLRAVPLAAFRYSDSVHQMLTITAAILRAEDVDPFYQQTELRQWEFGTNNWSDIRLIQVPDLSLRERFYIDSKLFTDADQAIHNALPYRFDPDDAKSYEVFQDYVRHRRRYPTFVRMIG